MSVCDNHSNLMSFPDDEINKQLESADQQVDENRTDKHERIPEQEKIAPGHNCQQLQALDEFKAGVIHEKRAIVEIKAQVKAKKQRLAQIFEKVEDQQLDEAKRLGSEIGALELRSWQLQNTLQGRIGRQLEKVEFPCTQTKLPSQKEAVRNVNRMINFAEKEKADKSETESNESLRHTVVELLSQAGIGPALEGKTPPIGELKLKIKMRLIEE